MDVVVWLVLRLRISIKNLLDLVTRRYVSLSVIIPREENTHVYISSRIIELYVHIIYKHVYTIHLTAKSPQLHATVWVDLTKQNKRSNKGTHFMMLLHELDKNRTIYV